MSRVTYECVMSHIHEARDIRTSHNNESFHVGMSHMTRPLPYASRHTTCSMPLVTPLADKTEERL